MDNQAVKVCELLTFAKHWYNRSSEAQLVKAVIGFYSAEEINKAKALLKEDYKQLLPHHKLWSERQTSSNRKQYEAETDDIVKVLHQTSEMDAPVQYVAANLARIPPYGPEEVNIVTVMQSMVAVEQRLRALEENNAKAVRDRAEEMARIEALERKPPQAALFSEVVTDGAAVTKRILPTRKSARRTSTVQTTPKPVTSQLSAESESTETLPEHAGRAEVLPEHAGDGFVTVGRDGKPLRPPRTQSQGVKHRQTVIRGTAEGGKLSGGPKTAEIQVRGIKLDHDESVLKEHMEESPRCVTVKGMREVTKPEWQTKTFIVTIDFADVEKVLSAEFWPRYISCRRWWFRPPGNNTNSRSASNADSHSTTS